MSAVRQDAVNDMMLEGHEQRIRDTERSCSDFVAHAAAEEYRFQMISDQIADLGEHVTDSLNRLNETVGQLAKQTSVHHEELKQVAQERKVALERKKKFKKFTIATALAITGAIGAKVGEALWGLGLK